MGNVYEEYCSGCGLCHSVSGINFHKNEQGALFPERISGEAERLCEEVCMAGKNAILSHQSNGVWGDYVAAFKGYSLNNAIRKAASSGGVLTTAAMFLLEQKIVDGIIQTATNPDCPWETETVCSRSSEDVLNHCGSKYTASSPLMNLFSLLKPGEKYAFVGKPCDVTVLRNYMKINKAVQKQIPFLFSFFCAGVPNETAQIALLTRLGCNPEKCTHLSYRGNGWPGPTMATDRDGHQYQITYEKAWMEILGKDIRRSCKFCFDGIGENADIACGDLWNLSENKKPDFTEADGNNIIFARTSCGNELLKSMQAQGKLYLQDYEGQLHLLQYCQPNHFGKRTTMIAMIMGMRLLGRKVPLYNMRELLRFAKHTNSKALLRRMLGTVKRTIKKKI